MFACARRLEEQCLVRSGLVKLLDRLCSLVDDQKPLEELKGSEDEDSLHRVTSMAWAAFQVLADHCVSWESEDSAVLSSGLAKQVGGACWHCRHACCARGREFGCILIKRVW